MVVYGALYLEGLILKKEHHVEGTMAEMGEKRFVRMSSESVRLCAERIGIQTSPEVSNALIEDVSFRIRQITDVSKVVVTY